MALSSQALSQRCPHSQGLRNQSLTVAFSPGGHGWPPGGWDGKFASGTSRRKTCGVFLAGHLKEVHQVAFSGDGRMLASVASDWKVILWDVETGRQERSLDVPMDTIRSVAFSPDGSQIAAAGVDGSIYFWTKADGRLRQKIEAHAAQILCLAYSTDGHRLATCAQDGVAKVWDVRSSRLLQTFSGHSSRSAVSRSAPTATRSQRAARTERFGFGTPRPARLAPC